MNASLLFPARLPREPFGGPEAAPLTSSSSSASSSSGEQRYRSNSNNNDNRRRGGVTSGRGGGGGGGDRSRGGVAAAAAARGRAPSLPQITPARRNPTPGARTAPKVRESRGNGLVIRRIRSWVSYNNQQGEKLLGSALLHEEASVRRLRVFFFSNR